MKRHIATLAIEVSAETTEARDFLVATIADDLNATLPCVTYRGMKTANVRRARVSRVRPVRRGK